LNSNRFEFENQKRNRKGLGKFRKQETQTGPNTSVGPAHDLPFPFPAQPVAPDFSPAVNPAQLDLPSAARLPAPPHMAQHAAQLGFLTVPQTSFSPRAPPTADTADPRVSPFTRSRARSPVPRSLQPGPTCWRSLLPFLLVPRAELVALLRSVAPQPRCSVDPPRPTAPLVVHPRPFFLEASPGFRDHAKPLGAIHFFRTPRITPRSQHRARPPLIPDLSLYLAPVHLPVLYYATPKPSSSPRNTSASPLLAQSSAPP
jgi:hypothetical protein